MKTLVKSNFKSLLNSMFNSFGARLITRSDRSLNGIKPYMLEYFLRQSNGILHIGAHEGQESEFYNSLEKPVIWIEANPMVYINLKTNIKKFSDQTAFNFMLAASDNKDRIFHFTSNNAHSASMFPLASNHSWSGLVNTHSIVLHANRLDTKFDVKDLIYFDFWIIDTQGAELEVLIGAGKTLTECCKYLLVEISQSEFYEGGASYQQVRDFLAKHDFVPLFEPVHNHEEVLFVNTTKLRDS